MASFEHHDFEKTIDYTFTDSKLLAEALRHSSFVNEQAISGLRDNERLEFLGDAVLNLVVGHLLMTRYPDLKEGELSRLRANLVNETTLAAIAGGIGLGNYLQLGKGEIQTHGCEKSSILADAFEALIAAIYLDSGFKAASRFIEGQFKTHLESIIAVSASHDCKSRLQELVQFSYKTMPQYRIIGESGPDHNKVFHVRLTINNIVAEGQGRSKKLAEQNAAQNALAILESDT